MKWLRLVSYLVVIVVLVAMGPGQPDRIGAPAVLAQGGDVGIFGFQQTDWDASFTLEGDDDGSLVYSFDDGGSVNVWLDGSGITTHVEYTLGTSLARGDMQSFVQGELLPSDARSIEQYPDFILGDGGQRVDVDLYQSDAVAQFFPSYSGMIVVAYAQDGSRFSLSIGTDM